MVSVSGIEYRKCKYLNRKQLKLMESLHHDRRTNVCLYFCEGQISGNVLAHTVKLLILF